MPIDPIRVATSSPAGSAKAGQPAPAAAEQARMAPDALVLTEPKPGLAERAVSPNQWLPRALDAVQDFFYQIADRLWTKTRSLRLESNPDNVNSPSWLDKLNARLHLRRSRAAERQALAAWPADRQKQYEQVAALTAHDPPARLALLALLRDGKLPGQPDLAGGKDLLANLAALGAQPLAPGLDRQALVSDLVQELQNPTAISQKGKGTCVATVGQMLMAKEHPAELVRLVAGLASPEGRVTLANGDPIARVADWNAGNDRQWHITRGRTASSRLLQPAFMDYGDGDRSYNNTADQHSDGSIGLGDDEANRLYEGLTGRRFSVQEPGPDEREAVLERIAAACRQGRSVPIGLEWGKLGHAHSYHKLLVDEVRGDRVYFVDPFGQRASLGKTEFLARLSGVNLPES